jgi:hypothetical protein
MAQRPPLRRDRFHNLRKNSKNGNLGIANATLRSGGISEAFRLLDPELSEHEIM